MDRQGVITMILVQLGSMLAVLTKFRQSMMGLLYRKISRDRKLLLCFKKRRNYVIYRCWEASDRRARRLPRSLWIKPGRTDQWWQNMITGKLGPENWKENFRLDRKTFFDLRDELHRHICPDPKSLNYLSLSSGNKVSSNIVLHEGHRTFEHDGKFVWTT